MCKSKNGELLSDYKDACSYVKVKCNDHNYIWDVLPNNLKKGRWCPICSMGFNEKVVWDYLNNMNCNIKIQHKFDDLIGKNNEKLKFDFAIFDNNYNLYCLIEVDDEEHKDRHFGNSKRQLERQESIKRDKLKDKYCLDNNIILYRMEVPFRSNNKWSYSDYYKYIDSKLKKIINMSKEDR